jgi:hypothetical protein
MIRVYIASAYTKGDTAINVKNQMDAFNTLLNEGFTPFAPLLFHFQHIAHPQPYNVWLRVDLEWLLVCDCVLRLPGESAGADQEVSLALKEGIPVFYSIEELLFRRDK